jgi:hypothetical protein
MAEICNSRPKQSQLDAYFEQKRNCLLSLMRAINVEPLDLRKCFNAQAGDVDHTARSETTAGRGGNHMLHSEPRASVNRNVIKFSAAAAAMAVLAGCAISMPLRPLATAPPDIRDNDFSCRAHTDCRDGSIGHRIAHRESQSVNGGKIDDDPPDFISNSGDQNGRLR